MKRLLFSVLLTILSLSAWAQPSGMNYQAIVRDNTGNILPNQNVAFRFSILKSNATGLTQYVERHTVSTTDFGLVSLIIGNGTLISGSLQSIDWKTDIYYLKTELDINGGNNYSLTGTKPLLGVPYAFGAPDKQTLSLTGTQLSISNGNTISLPTGGSSFNLPYAGTYGGSQIAFHLTATGNLKRVLQIDNNGTTKVGMQINNGPNADNALEIINNSSDNAIRIEQIGDDNALSISQDGNDEAISILQKGNDDALQINHDGTEHAINIDNTTSGKSGVFINHKTSFPALEINGIPGSSGELIRLENDGNDDAISIIQNGGGEGIYLVQNGNNEGVYIDQNADSEGLQIRQDGNDDGLYVDQNGSGRAGYFSGNVDVNGSISKNSGSFKIDHPLDPANKFLFHSFVESPDMMNIYNGIVTTDAQGEAEVVLPTYFESLNIDFRYQLTCIGIFARAIVKQEINDSRFTIQTDMPHVKVSWQVTGIRKDPYAEAHRIQVEVEKAVEERGYYLHPELYGQPESSSIEVIYEQDQ